MGWFKDFFNNIFGDFWGALANVFMKFLVGPIVYYLFGPMYELSGYMVMKILERLEPQLGKVGMVADGLGAWFIEVLRLHETFSMFLTFLILGLTIRFINKVF
jgi:hypothetical protein